MRFTTQTDTESGYSQLLMPPLCHASGYDPRARLLLCPFERARALLFDAIDPSSGCFLQSPRSSR